jgi:hypothetical protein
MQIKQEEVVSRCEHKLLQNIQAVVTDHDDFKAEVHSEIESLRLLLGQSASVNQSNLPFGQSSSSNIIPPTNPTSSPTIQSPSIRYSPAIPNSTVSGLNPSTDPHGHLMVMMTEAFSKLTTVFTETKSSEMKSEWPTFDGTKTKFRSWYLTILSQVSVSPWNGLYNTTTNDLVTTTTNSSLNASSTPSYYFLWKGQLYEV